MEKDSEATAGTTTIIYISDKDNIKNKIGRHNYNLKMLYKKQYLKFNKVRLL